MQLLKKVFGLLFAVMVLLDTHLVQAQFPGDAFFSQPSIVIPEGGQGTLQLQAFVGSDTFGAIHVTLLYDPSQLEIVSVQPGTSSVVQNGFTFTRVDAGISRINIIALNSQSLTRPIGTVSLALLEVRPLAAAGSVINIRNVLRQTLRQDSSAFFVPRGFAAEIVVTDPGTTVARSARIVKASRPVTVVTETSDADLYSRATALRPVGSTLDLMILDSNNRASPRRLRTQKSDVPIG